MCLPPSPHHLSKYAIFNVRAQWVFFIVSYRTRRRTVFVGVGGGAETLGLERLCGFTSRSAPRRLINYCWPLKSSRITARKWFITTSRPEDGRNNNKIIISVATGTRLLSNTQLSRPQTVPPSLQL